MSVDFNPKNPSYVAPESGSFILPEQGRNVTWRSPLHYFYAHLTDDLYTQYIINNLSLFGLARIASSVSGLAAPAKFNFDKRLFKKCMPFPINHPNIRKDADRGCFKGSIDKHIHDSLPALKAQYNTRDRKRIIRDAIRAKFDQHDSHLTLLFSVPIGDIEVKGFPDLALYAEYDNKRGDNLAGEVLTEIQKELLHHHPESLVYTLKRHGDIILESAIALRQMGIEPVMDDIVVFLMNSKASLESRELKHIPITYAKELQARYKSETGVELSDSDTAVVWKYIEYHLQTLGNNQQLISDFANHKSHRALMYLDRYNKAFVALLRSLMLIQDLRQSQGVDTKMVTEALRLITGSRSVSGQGYGVDVSQVQKILSDESMSQVSAEVASLFAKCVTYLDGKYVEQPISGTDDTVLRDRIFLFSKDEAQEGESSVGEYRVVVSVFGNTEEYKFGLDEDERLDQAVPMITQRVERNVIDGSHNRTFHSLLTDLGGERSATLTVASIEVSECDHRGCKRLGGSKFRWRLSRVGPRITLVIDKNGGPIGKPIIFHEQGMGRQRKRRSPVQRRIAHDVTYKFASPPAESLLPRRFETWRREYGDKDYKSKRVIPIEPPETPKRTYKSGSPSKAVRPIGLDIGGKDDDMHINRSDGLVEWYKKGRLHRVIDSGGEDLNVSNYVIPPGGSPVFGPPVIGGRTPSKSPKMRTFYPPRSPSSDSVDLEEWIKNPPSAAPLPTPRWADMMDDDDDDDDESFRPGVTRDVPEEYDSRL